MNQAISMTDTQDQKFSSRMSQIKKIKDAAVAAKESIANQSSSSNSLALLVLLTAVSSFGFLCVAIFTNFFPEIYTIQKPDQELSGINILLAFGIFTFGIVAMSLAYEWRIKVQDRKNPQAKIEALRNLLANYKWKASQGYSDLINDTRASGHIDLVQVFSLIQTEKEAVENSELRVPVEVRANNK